MAKYPVVEMKKVTKIYGTTFKTTALSDLDLVIEEGSLNAVIGQSGSGKSTLLNLIGTLDTPTSGEIYINNVRIDTMSKKELAFLRNQTIGFVFQFHFLLPEFTALENIFLPYNIKDKPVSSDIMKHAEDLIRPHGFGKSQKQQSQ